mgnify:CR=1 FL=1
MRSGAPARNVLVRCLGHPKATKKGYVYAHVLVVEKTLGKYLPPNVVIHHVDNNPRNNNASNLVVCENQQYHMLLHRRTTALRECGHANWRKCNICQQYGQADTMSIVKQGYNGDRSYHKKCAARYVRTRNL